MTRVLVVDNYDSFVYNLVHYLAQLGAECVVRRNDEVGAMLKSDPDMPDAEVTPEDCINSMVIAGSPRSVAEQPRRISTGSGALRGLHDFTS